MRFTLPRTTTKGALAALGAGLAAALMVAAATRHMALTNIKLGAPLPAQQLLPVSLLFLAPLPLMIVAIGFDLLAALLALLVGALAFGGLGLLGASPDRAMLVADAGARALGFVLTFGLPAVLLGRFAARPAPPPKALDAAPSVRTLRPDERLLATLLTGIVVYAALFVAAAAVAVIQVKGGYSALETLLKGEVERLLAADPDAKKIGTLRLVHFVIWFGALTVTAQLVTLFSVNLWLAARIAQTSSLLQRPWPALPQNLRLPRAVAVAAAVALGLSFAGGLVGVVGAIATGALAAGFGFQGLAVVHAMSLARAWRTPILMSIYLALGFFPPLLLVFALLGLCDAAFFFRDREKPTPPPPGPWDRARRKP